MISLTGISKSFAGVAALSDVSLTIVPGRIHAVLGENGAGKSTLMNVLFGLVRPDAGLILVAGRGVDIASPSDAQRLGIGMVHQHFKLVPTLSVLDNLILALQPGLGRIDRAAWRERIVEQAARLRWQVDPAARIDSLSVGQQQRVEILKALLVVSRSEVARTLVLDEPTAVLTPQEADELLIALRALAADGTAVVFISHKLDEVRRVADEVSVLRRGRVVHHGLVAGQSTAALAELMIGGRVESPQHTPRPAALDAQVLVALDAVSIHRAGGARLLDQVSLTVRAGEVVGIAGVDGNGQTSLVQTLLGVIRPDAGSVRVEAPLQRLGLIPEDRQREALVLPLSLRGNLLLKRYREAPFSRHGWLSHRAWDAHAHLLMKAFDVRAAGPDVPVSALSGGNQQKAVIARELHVAPSVIIAVNPTRGLDVGAAASVLRRLIVARDAGTAVLLVHSDLDELLAISDRVLVMHGGRLLDSGWPAADRDHIGRLMLGVA